MIAPRPNVSGKNLAVPAIALLAVLFAAVVAVATLRGGGSSVGMMTLAVPLAAALTPVALFFALRWPLIFPFGLWAALVPFDMLLGSGPTGTVTRYVELLAIVMIALKIVASRRMLAAPRSWYAWFLVVCWMLLTALWSIGPAKTQLALVAIVPLFLLMTLLAVYPISVAEMRGVLVAIVVGALGSAAYGFQLYSQGRLGGDGRVTLLSDSGLEVDANFYATSFLLPIAVCLSVALCHRSILMRLAAVAAAFAMVGAIFLSGSRGAFLSCAVVFVYFMVKTRNRLAMLGVTAGASVAFIAFPTVLRRLSEDKTASNGSGRTFIWEVGARALGEHFHWLTGAGIGAFPVAYDRSLTSVYQQIFEGWSRPAHNVVVGIAVELGIFGLAGLLYAWWTTFRLPSSIARSSPNYALRVGAEAAILALFVNALFIDPMVIKYYWLAFMLPLMLHNVERPVRARAQDSTQRLPATPARGLFVRRLRRS